MKRPDLTPRKPAPIRKVRRIRFAALPPGQISTAARFLGHLEHLEIRQCQGKLALEVAYDLNEHSLEELETALLDRGFRLDNALFCKLERLLIYYIEETQLHNLEAPERLLRKSQNTAYTQAWERHLHGDHDDTPPEWREYK